MTAPARDFTVIRVGTDTSGRTIWMTRYAWTVWQAVLAHPLVKPFAWKVTIVQGAFMLRNGGGATASAGVHDGAGCWDVRTWNLTTAELDTLIHVCRFEAGIAAWRRDQSSAHGGMDPHCHNTFGDDHPLAGGAIQSWSGYLHGTNGLANGAHDYERRPSPLVTKPKATLFAEEDYMETKDAKAQFAALHQEVADLTKLVSDLATDDQRRWIAERERDKAEKKRQSERYRTLVSKIAGLVDHFTEEGNGEAVAKLKTLLADEPDVTGADNPVQE